MVWNSRLSSRWNSIGFVALSVFATVSVFGQGLHFLPGANHDSEQGHSCAYCHQHDTPDPTESDANVHDCLICKFLAQAQFQAHVRIELPLVHSFELINDGQPLRMAFSFNALHLARAPPVFS